MNAIAVPCGRKAEKDAIQIYDVNRCVRSRGRRGIFWGSLIGFVVGAIFVTNPPAGSDLAFGIFGTLIVCIAGCGAAAGTFGVLAAALNGYGDLRSDPSEWERRLAEGRLSEGFDRRHVPSLALSIPRCLVSRLPVRIHSINR